VRNARCTVMAGNAAEQNAAGICRQQPAETVAGSTCRRLQRRTRREEAEQIPAQAPSWHQSAEHQNSPGLPEWDRRHCRQCSNSKRQRHQQEPRQEIWQAGAERQVWQRQAERQVQAGIGALRHVQPPSTHPPTSTSKRWKGRSMGEQGTQAGKC